jgi:superfamily I DNA/RNA helicase
MRITNLMSRAHAQVIPVLKIEGPPGSGKTRELAREACRLIVQDGIPAEQLVMLSATALGRERLLDEFTAEAELAGYQGRRPNVQPLHQWLLGLLAVQKTPNASTAQPVKLLKESDALAILQEILRESVPEGHPLFYATRQVSASRVFMGLIQQLQIKGLSAQDVRVITQDLTVEDPRLPLVSGIYERFETVIRAGNMVCYAQLAHRAFALLASNENIRSAVQASARVILVDEAQALSSVVYRLLALLGSRLVLAGNEKLSIRSYRGAEPEEFVTLQAYQSALGEAGLAQVAFLPKQACFRGNDAILSLLNEFLPQPIWESHTLEKEQLAEQVKFGYFKDPQQEAERVAAHLAAFVKNQTPVPNMGSEIADGETCAARWSDCVVLLRTGHYKQHLLHAFEQQGIPYRWEMLSAETVRLQHGLYDLFKVFSEWQALKISPNLLQDGNTLHDHWMSSFSVPQDQEQWTVENNRHLLRALEILFLDEAQIAALRHLPAFNPSNLNEYSWLLPELCNIQALPADLATVGPELLALYERLAHENSAADLLEALLDRLAENRLCDPGFTASLSVLQTFQENLLELDSHYQASFGRPLPLQGALEHFSSLWEGAESVQDNELSGAGQDCIRILGLHQAQGEEFPLVIIPFLVSGEFPYTRELPELLSAPAQAVLGVEVGYPVLEAEEARLLASGMTRARQQVMLSSHSRDESGMVLPSSFYTRLLQAKRRLLEQPLQREICLCRAETGHDEAQWSVDYCSASVLEGWNVEREIDSPGDLGGLDRYTGASLWAQLSLQPAEPLFEPQETLSISASSIKTYMQCPRQFYYKHLLRLPQPGSDAAALGTLIHRVMEVFNRQAERIPYTVESLTRIAESLFLAETDEAAFEAAGYEERDRYNLARLSPLGLTQLRQRLMASIEDLVEKGYFDRYGSLRRVYPEKTLEDVVLPGIKRARFRGAMDAVIELADGSVEILDYKTFRSAYGAKLDTCDKYFLKTLEPLPEDEDLSHEARFEGKLSATYPTDYQLPLYYLACKQDPALRDKLSEVALQIIRPAFAENPHQGSIRLALTGEQIEACQQRLIEDINRYIVSPILESDAFSPNPAPNRCSGCAYLGICDTADETGSAEEELA